MKPGMAWPIGITMILATTVVGNLIMMRVANDDPSFAVEADYYQRAVDFDTTMHQQSRSDALGWMATATIGEFSDGKGVLRVQLRGKNAEPIVADSVTAVAFFNGRANDREHVALMRAPSDTAGVYQHEVAVAHAGQWIVMIDAWRGAEHFVETARVEVAKVAALPPGPAK